MKIKLKPHHKIFHKNTKEIQNNKTKNNNVYFHLCFPSSKLVLVLYNWTKYSTRSAS